MGLPRGFISSWITGNFSFLFENVLSLLFSAAAEVFLCEKLNRISDLMKMRKMIEIALTRQCSMQSSNENVSCCLQGILCPFHKETVPSHHIIKIITIKKIPFFF